MILIIENFLEQIVITVTDELSHCGAVSTVKTTPHTATNNLRIMGFSTAYYYDWPMYSATSE